MIIQILFMLIFGILSAMASFLPGYGDIPLLLPWGIDEVFTNMSSYFHGAIETLPYLEIVLQCFLYALLFEIALFVIKLILGSRAPGQHAN